MYVVINMINMIVEVDDGVNISELIIAWGKE